MTVILTYHAVETGPAPLCIAPDLFARHVAAIADSGVDVLTVTEVARRLRAGELERAVAITFDDGCASVVEHAAPVLRAHGMRATMFCVAGRLGAVNDWPTQASWAPRFALASAGAIDELVADGWEIGSHGVEHAPLDRIDVTAAHREVVESRIALEAATAAQVTSFAWPYGRAPASPGTRALIGETYEAACGGGLRPVDVRSDPLGLPRIDAHYLRDPRRLRRALEGSNAGYLALRRVAAGARRRVRGESA